MTCDCIERIEKKILESFNEKNRYGKKITKLHIEEKALMISLDLDNGRIQTHSTLKITFESGRCKEEKLIHSFCPFCGKPEREVK